MDAVPDKSVLRQVNQRLSRLGGSQGHVTASVSRGTVTLTGTIQFEIQRQNIVKVATSVPGVRTVSDQLRVKPKERPSFATPTKPYVPKTAAERAEVMNRGSSRPAVAPAAVATPEAPNRTRSV